MKIYESFNTGENLESPTTEQEAGHPREKETVTDAERILEQRAIDRVLEVRKGIATLAKNGDWGSQDRVANWSREFKKAVPDWNNYDIYHALVFSDPPEGNPNRTTADLEGEFSVLAFANRLAREMRPKLEALQESKGNEVENARTVSSML